MAQFLLVAVILCDLYAFHWGDLNRIQRQKEGNDYLEQLMAGEDMANFFKSQPGLFRVHMDANVPDFINIGEMFGVQTTQGWSGATLYDYMPFLWNPKTLDLLNVRYIAVKGKDLPGQPVYTQGAWKVYENPTECPRAWVVHRLLPGLSIETIKTRLQDPNFDLQREAFVGEPIGAETLGSPSASDSLRFTEYGNNRLELTVDAATSGMLVLSEMYYPGWEATVNGTSAHIYKIDGILRGVVIPAGESHVVMRYRPTSVYAGAVLTVFAYVGVSIFAGIVLLGEKKSRRWIGGD